MVRTFRWPQSDMHAPRVTSGRQDRQGCNKRLGWEERLRKCDEIEWIRRWGGGPLQISINKRGRRRDKTRNDGVKNLLMRDGLICHGLDDIQAQGPRASVYGPYLHLADKRCLFH